MTVEVVADGIHVPPTILRLVDKIKGVERTCLITDALACAASDSREAFDPRVIIEDGVCKLADHSALAGSVATMDRLIRTMVQKAEIPWQTPYEWLLKHRQRLWANTTAKAPSKKARMQTSTSWRKT